MSEQQSLPDKGKQAARNVGGRIQSIRNTLTGKSVEQTVAEHSELYTQVLLGLHRDLQTLDNKVQSYAFENDRLKRQVASISSIKILALVATFVAVPAAILAIIGLVQ